MIKRYKQKGKFISNGVIIEKHEMDTVEFLLYYCKVLEVVVPPNIKGVRSPDIKLDGVVRESDGCNKNPKRLIKLDGIIWEMKSPVGHSKRTIERILKSAIRQSNNIVLDLRRIKLPTDACNYSVRREFQHNKSLKNLVVITKESELLDLYKG